MSKVRGKDDRPMFLTDRRAFSYSTCISAMPKSSDTSDLISPWNLKLPAMNHARHSAGAVALGKLVMSLRDVTTCNILSKRISSIGEGTT